MHWEKEMELPGKRKRGRPKRWFIEAMRDDMQVTGVPKEDAETKTR